MNSPTILIGASIPRSGHHFLASTLKEYFSEEMKYCEFYVPSNCCRKIPCEAAEGYKIIYQKNHDFDFSLDKNIGSANYVIQYRHPTLEMASDWELARRDSLGGAPYRYRLSSEYFSWWLAQKAVYYKKFYRKWFMRPPKKSILIDYEALQNDTFNIMASVIRLAGHEVDEPRLVAAIGRSSPVRATMRTAYVPRTFNYTDFAYPYYIAPFEQHVLANCPGFNFEPILGGGYEGNYLQGLILLLDPDETIPSWARDRLEAAVQLAGSHPEVRLRVARRQLDEQNITDALDSLNSLVCDFPHFLPAWQMLFRLSRESTIPPRVGIISSDAIMAAAHNWKVMVPMARMLLDEGQLVAAASALQIAVGVFPSVPQPRALLAVAWQRLGRKDQAYAEAEAVLQLDPDNAQAKGVLARGLGSAS